MMKAIVPILSDFYRALRMRFSIDANRRAEGRVIATDVRRRFNVWLIIPLAALFSCILFLMALIPPYGITSIGFLVLGACFIWLAFPNPLKVSDSWKTVNFRYGGFAALTITMAFLMSIKESEIESARTPEQKERIAKAEQARAEEQFKAERIARSASELEADARIENRRQREFYEQLGAPKLLYRCNTSPFETAIGAKFGTVNMLISGAEERCGEAGYEVLKKKE